MKKKLILTDDLVINAIMVTDLETNNVFFKHNLNITIAQFRFCVNLDTLFDEGPKLPNILNKELTYERDSSGFTSKGYKYQASAYSYKGPDVIIALSVIEGVESKIGSDVYNLFVTDMN
jgi:hypothetical protein